ncbi:TPA: hypothetical protein HA338_02670 [Methanosarcina acetivorans]|nr:hypothetical protein [Methanosarcina acetivorans]HIH92971.1 hypothetical protein [Methanosarcina acetivorans]
MNKYFKILLILLLVVLVPITVLYGSFMFMLIYYDQAYYYSEGTNLGSPEYYDKVVYNAGEAGYKTEIYYVNAKEKEIPGLRPGTIEGLDPRLGSDYLVNSLDIYYSDSSWISISFLDDQESSVSFYSDDSLAKYRPDELPEREWIVQIFKIIFGMSGEEVEAYLPAEDWEVNDVFFDQVIVTETPDFAAIHKYLVKEATDSTFDAQTSGEGWCTETFYNESQKIGSIYYIVPNVEISHREGWSVYTVKIDRLGGLYLKVSLGPGSSGKTIPEDEYRAVFKRMFTDLGLPPEKVDEFEFRYSGGNW